MTKLKKTTTARIEDALDIVADKIIDLENTAKQLEMLKRSISQEISRAENISIKLNIDNLKENQKRYIDELEILYEKNLKDIDKKNNVHDPLYYLIYVLMTIVLIESGILIFILRR